MNLKNVLLKSFATTMAISMIFGNVSICGMGISKAIAEDASAPEPQIEWQHEKYVQYQKEEKASVAIQSKLTLYTDQEKESYLPTKSVEANINLPSLNGVLPEKALVAQSATKLTTGEENNTNINQYYDKNTGVLKISYQNNEENINFNENAKDEFEIIYYYGTEAYTGNREEINLPYYIQVKETFKTKEGTISSEASKKIDIKEKGNTADITAFQLEELTQKIYKGFLYSNVENQTKYDTEFKTVSTYTVLNSQFADENMVELKEAKFELNDEYETEIPSNENVVYTATGINKEEFDKLLGQEGKVEIYQGEEVIATVGYIETQEGKELAVIYADGAINFLQEEDTTAIIKYPNDMTALKIKISKPISEGFLHIEHQNKIKAAKDYGVNVETIKAINITAVINQLETETKLALVEPETKISITSSNENFSTLQTSKTTLTIKLDDTNNSCKLFNNPTITVKLPEGLTKGNLSSPEIVNGNGLKLDSAKAEGNIITIQLKGKQNAYDLKNISGGVSIVMDIENIQYQDTLPTHLDKIEVTCKQNKEEIKVNCNVNIVSKAGLLMISKLSNYDNSKNTVTTIDSNVETVNIESNAKEREILQTIDLVNNYQEDLSNVQIIGKIGYSNNEIKSTFDTTLTKPIIADGTVYYTTNKEAKYDDISWTEQFTAKAKAYKVVFNKQPLHSKQGTQIKVYTKLPANLEYNQETYIHTDVNYIYNEKNINDTTIIGMVSDNHQLLTNKAEQPQETGNPGTSNFPLSISVVPAITTPFVHANQLVTYQISVTNHGYEDLKNIKLIDIIPTNAIYTYENIRETLTGETKDLIKAPDTKQKELTIKNLPAGETYQTEIMLTMGKAEQEQNVTNVVQLAYQEQTTKAESTLLLKPSNISVDLRTDSDDIEDLTYPSGAIVEYHVVVKNLIESDVNNLKVQYTIPENLEFVEGGLGQLDVDTYKIIEQSHSHLENGKWEYNIETLSAHETKTIIIRCKVKRLKNATSATIESFATVQLGEDIYQSGVHQIKTTQAAFNMILSADTKDKEVLKKDDEVIYTIQVKNVGERTGTVNIAFKLAEELELKEVTYSTNGQNVYTFTTTNPEIAINNAIEPNDVLTITITAKVKEIKAKTNSIITIENTAVLGSGDFTMESNKVAIKIQPEVEESKPSIPDTPTQPTDPTQPNNPEEPPTEGQEPQQKVFSISGIAWIDENKNGKREENEKRQNSVNVSLIDKQTGNFALDANGNRITTTTDETGMYTFTNLAEGTYIVLFEFDTNTYTVATYQKAGVEDALNSDVILSNITIDGQEKVAAVTDEVELTANRENIDIGLITNATFDLSLEKQITKITVVNSQGTEVTDYDGTDTAKVDLVAKYMNTANVMVNYRFTIKNEGDVTGYVNNLVDDLPSGLEFSSELNQDWFQTADGKLSTTALSGTAIEPGETVEIELILTKKMTEENAGVFPNKAELEKISNLQNIPEKEEAKENNQSSATLIISIKTGSAWLYIGITVLCLAIISLGVYMINKKVLRKGI